MSEKRWHDNPDLVIAGPLTPEQQQEYVLRLWRAGHLWKLVGDPKCMHRWQPGGNGFICFGDCGGFLMPVVPPEETGQ